MTGAEGVHLNLTLRQNYSVFMNEVNSRYHGPALAVDPKVDQEIFAWSRVGGQAELTKILDSVDFFVQLITEGVIVFS